MAIALLLLCYMILYFEYGLIVAGMSFRFEMNF
jgi:hypothetical protein